MPTPDFVSERERNARKYEELVVALRKASEVLQSLSKDDGQVDIDRVLCRLTHDLVGAFEAQAGIILQQARSSIAVSSHFRVIDPDSGSEVDSIVSSYMQCLINERKTVRIKGDALDVAKIADIRLHDALLIPLRTQTHFYVIAFCNKRDSEQYPFLAADEHVLDYLMTPVIAEIRAAERLTGEHRAIREISERIAQVDSTERPESEGSLWKLITAWVTKLTHTKYAAIYAIDQEKRVLHSNFVWNAETAQLLDNANAGEVLLSDPKSLNARVANSRFHEYIADLDDSRSNVWRHKFEEDARSAFCAPLISRGELVGTIYIASVIRDGISADCQSTIDRLAHHVAVAMHNAQLFDQRREQLEFDEKVIRIQLGIADVLREKEQMEQIKSVLSHHGVSPDEHNLFIATYEQDLEEIRLHTVYELEAPLDNLERHKVYRPRRRDERRGLIDYMLQKKMTSLDVQDFEVWTDRVEIEEAFQQGLKCCLVVELRHEGDTIGWLGLRGYQRPRMFGADLRTLLEKSAPHIAVVLHNTRQYEERVRERQVVSDFQTKISNLQVSEEKEITQITAEVINALGELRLDTRDMYIALCDAESQQITVPVVHVGGQPLSAAEHEHHPAYRQRGIDERNGFAEWVFRTGEPILAGNARAISAFRKRHGLDELPQPFRSWLGVPMRSSGKPIGVMALRSFDAGVFAESHLQLLQTVANQAAVTIENARHYQRVADVSRRNEALYQAGKAITAAGVKRDEVLNTIVEQAVVQTKSHLGMLYLINDDVLEPVAVYSSIEKDYQLDPFSAREKSIITLAIEKNGAQLVPDVRKHPYYNDVSNDVTRSELAVVLRRGGREDGAVIGVLNVEHPEIGGLQTRDQRFLVSLANMAVIAIDKSEQELAVRRSSVVATTGAFGAEILHEVNRKVGDIIWDVGNLLEHDDLPSAMKDVLQEIDRDARSIRLPPLPRDGSLHVVTGDDNDWEPPFLNEVIDAEIGVFDAERSARAGGAQIEFTPDGKDVQVNIHEFWLRRLLRHYLMNADVHPPTEGDRQHRIVVCTQVNNDRATVSVQDNGCGVPPEIAEQLFELPIDQPERFTGRGLLLVSWICAEYGGEARLDQNVPGEGARFAFWVPIWHENRRSKH